MIVKRVQLFVAVQLLMENAEDDCIGCRLREQQYAAHSIGMTDRLSWHIGRSLELRGTRALA